MELQLAMDHVELEDAYALVKEVGDLVDIVEMGTPFVLENDIKVFRTFKDILPESVRLLADYKIMDGGDKLAKMAFDAGADITTISARTWLTSIERALGVARARGKEILVDFMGVPDEEYERRLIEIDVLKPDYVCIHRMSGNQDSIKALLTLTRGIVKNTKIAIAGSIHLEDMREILSYQAKPDLVIVGKYVTRAERPRELLLALREVIGG